MRLSPSAIKRSEGRRIAKRRRENRPERIADGAFVGYGDHVQGAGRVAKLPHVDGEPMLAPQEGAEGREVFRNTSERIHHRRGVVTDPMPKSVSRP